MKHVQLHQSCQRGWRWCKRFSVVLLLPLVLVVVSLVGGGSIPAQAAPDLSSISGTVTRASLAVTDALVVASHSGTTRAAPTDANGSYSLNGLAAGTYALSVRPATITTTSPDWVYTGDAVLVNVPPTETQNLSVQPATVTINGQVAAPNGEPFTAPNRAWVRAENQEGQGNTVQVAADGSFSIKVLPGVVLLSLRLENDTWEAPTTLRGSVYYAEAGETIIVDRLQVVVKTAQISGTVSNLNSALPVAGIPVRAWRLDGAEFEQTVTDSLGNYSLAVISGTWLLPAVPLESSDYVPAQPPQRVVLPNDTATATKNLLIATSDISIEGRTVDSASGEPLSSGVTGRAYALYRAADGKQVLMGPSAAIRDGVFTLKLASSVAQNYSIGLYFPPDVPYTALSRVTVNGSQTLDIPIMADNSRINGVVEDRNGTVVSGVAGSVWAASDSGGWAYTRVNPLDGSYTLSVSATDLTGKGGSTWAVRAFVDPTSGYIVQRPRLQRVFLPYNNGEGSTANLDFTLVATASFGTVQGVVTAPNGTPLPGVRVAVRELSSDAAAAYSRWTYTDRLGRYRLRVPAGSYRVSAHYGERLRDRPIRDQLIEPAPLSVTVAANGQQNADLRFRPSDTRVAGQVRYNGNPYPALVRARSADGATVAVRARADGSFTLGLKANLQWTIAAVASDQSSFLRSNSLTIIPAPATTPIMLDTPLVLTTTADLPDSQAFVFSANEDQLFAMADGSQVQVPAGALAESGNVALTVRPLPELTEVGEVQPVSFGYRLHAYDELRRPITHFLRPVTLLIPFSAEQLAALGITPDQLVPAYWDEASASWKLVDNVAVIPNASGGGTVQITVDHFTDFALLASTGGRTYLPLVVR